MGLERVRQAWRSLSTSQREVPAQAWKCPDDGEIVLVIPEGEPIPEESEQVTCPNGHSVTVPKYRGPRPEETDFVEWP